MRGRLRKLPPCSQAGWKVFPMEPREGVEEGKTSSTWSSLAPDPPFLRDTPTLGWTVADGQLLLPHTHTHSRTYIHKHTSHCQSQHLPLESRTAVCVTSAAASWAEVLSEPLTSLRINAEASGCVDLNHKEACWSRGSDFPGLASGLYKLQGAGRCSDLPRAPACQRGAFGAALPQHPPCPR